MKINLEYEFYCCIFVEQKQSKMKILKNVDLFETIEDTPISVQNIVNKYSDVDNTYENCEKLVKELEEVGWTCEYELSGVPFNLHQIDEPTNGDYEILFNVIIPIIFFIFLINLK